MIEKQRLDRFVGVRLSLDEWAVALRASLAAGSPGNVSAGIRHLIEAGRESLPEGRPEERQAEGAANGH